MVQLIRSLSEFIINRSNSWGFKTAFIISLFGIIIGFDYLMKISYNLHQNNKLGQIEKAVSIKPYYKSDSISLEKIKEIEYQTLNKGHYSEKIDEFLFGESDYKSTIRKTKDTIRSIEIKYDTIYILIDSTSEMPLKLDATLAKEKKNNKLIDSLRYELYRKEVKVPSKNTRNLFWMVITSNYLLVIIAFIMLFIPFVDGQKIDGNLIFGWIASYVILGLWATVTTWVAFKIPIIANNPMYNYGLNLLIHTIFVVLLFSITSKK